MSNKIETKVFTSSSMIARADFDPIVDSVKIYFKSGEVYEFCGVPRNIFEEMSVAPSVGKYFRANIRGKYEHLRKM